MIKSKGEPSGDKRESGDSQIGWSGKKNGPAAPSVTETVLAVLGGLSLVIGVMWTVGVFLAGGSGDNQAVGPSWMPALIVLLNGLIASLSFFAVHLVLQYLRRIVNAQEARNCPARNFDTEPQSPRDPEDGEA
jgi:hypothetical protein